MLLISYWIQRMSWAEHRMMWTTVLRRPENKRRRNNWTLSAVAPNNKTDTEYKFSPNVNWWMCSVSAFYQVNHCKNENRAKMELLKRYGKKNQRNVQRYSFNVFHNTIHWLVTYIMWRILMELIWCVIVEGKFRKTDFYLFALTIKCKWFHPTTRTNYFKSAWIDRVIDYYEMDFHPHFGWILLEA